MTQEYMDFRKNRAQIKKSKHSSCVSNSHSESSRNGDFGSVGIPHVRSSVLR